MHHVEDTSAGWIMAHNDIVSFIVVEIRVSIHDLANQISADFGKHGAEQNSHLGLKPAGTGHKLVDSHFVVPLKNIGFFHESHEMGLLIAIIRYGSKGKIFIKVALHNLISFA